MRDIDKDPFFSIAKFSQALSADAQPKVKSSALLEFAKIASLDKLDKRKVNLLDSKIFIEHIERESLEALKGNNLPQLLKLIFFLRSVVRGKKSSLLTILQKLKESILLDDAFMHLFLSFEKNIGGCALKKPLTAEKRGFEKILSRLLTLTLQKKIFKKDASQQSFINCLKEVKQIKNLELLYFNLLERVLEKYFPEDLKSF